MIRRDAVTKQLRSWQLNLLGAGIIALGAAWLVAGTDSAEFYRGWLLGFLPCWEATIGCLGMLMLHHLMGGNWGRAVRPILEAGTGLLPLVALGFLPIALHLDAIFPWTGDAATDDPLLAHKAAYLNEQAFWTRAVVYFSVWMITWRMLVPIWPRDSVTLPLSLMPRRGALGLILLIVAASFAAIDWGMSLEPHWFSAIYGAIFVVGGAVAALALAIIAVSVLRIGHPVPGISRKRIRNDLGSLLLAMLMVWMYFSFSQFLIIWSANLPEENVWYLARQQHGWQLLGVLVVMMHFVVPFAALLSQDVRAHPRTLARVAALVLAAHTLFLFWTIAPAFYENVADVSWTCIATLVGTICFWSAGWLFLLERRQSSRAGDSP